MPESSIVAKGCKSSIVKVDRNLPRSVDYQGKWAVFKTRLFLQAWLTAAWDPMEGKRQKAKRDSSVAKAHM